jgi:exopolyphosphatase/guanosine-5'-triphosphate,3'-diphosphate pyrophosphatase
MNAFPQSRKPKNKIQKTLNSRSNMERRAVIDIGTNSVKLLVGDIQKTKVTPVLETAIQTRLGEDFFKTGRIATSALETTLKAVLELHQKAKNLSASKIRIISTGVARHAPEIKDLFSKIKAMTGEDARILSPDQEALLAYKGVTTSPTLHHLTYLVVFDVGGGSTELILGNTNKIIQWASCELGAVQLWVKYSKLADDPPGLTLLNNCRTDIRSRLLSNAKNLFQSAIPLVANTKNLITVVGTGGTCTILGCVANSLTEFDRERIESTPVSFNFLTELCETVWTMNLSQRKTLPGMPPDRADIFPYGLAIVVEIISMLCIPSFYISTRGVRFGSLIE